MIEKQFDNNGKLIILITNQLLGPQAKYFIINYILNRVLNKFSKKLSTNLIKIHILLFKTPTYYVKTYYNLQSTRTLWTD